MDGSRINHRGTESTDKVCCGTACVQEWQPPTQGGGFGREKHFRLVHLVPHFINTATFATRDFWPRRGASDAHTLPGSVRSEQRRRGQKEPSPGGLRRFSVLASLLLGHSPTSGDAPSLRLARTENRRNKRGRIYETGYLARLSQLAAEINDFSGVRSRNLLAY